MIVGVARETFPDELRVAITPHVVPALGKASLELVVESGAGAAAGFPDSAYEAKGAQVVATRDEVLRRAEVLLQVRGYGVNQQAGRADLERLRPGQVLIGFFDPLSAPEAARELAARGVTVFAMELMPRITRAQSMDALSSMATVAGYKAVLLAASTLGKMFPMLMTAAGTITPARVFVLGAGVAGLQAIATARRLGAVVQAYDVRPTVKQEVESLGAKFIDLPLEATDAEDRGGYARALDEDFYQRQRETMPRVLAECNVAITTAAIPGKQAPVLITHEMVTHMAPGSVIVDLAAERGGNCELTRPGETIVEHGVTILGPINLPATVATDASQMYARNISSFLLHLRKDGAAWRNPEDQIATATLVAHDGEVVHPRVRAALGLGEPTPAAAEAAPG